MRISQATEGINCLQCIDDLIQEAVAFFFPFSVLRVMGDVIRGRADGGVWICMWCGYVSTLTDLCTAD